MVSNSVRHVTTTCDCGQNPTCARCGGDGSYMREVPQTVEEVKPDLGCDHQGHEFGAHYLDSVCIDGYLWDADSGDAAPDGEGWVYTRGGDIPCPNCNKAEHEAYRAGDSDE